MSRTDVTMPELLQLERIDEWVHRSTAVYDDPLPMFGGHVIAQSILAAAATTAPDRAPHSLHGYFLRSGKATEPVVYYVDGDFDGGSFSSRRVVAKQHGDVIFNATISFQRSTDGPDHQMVAPTELPNPADLFPWPIKRHVSLEMRSFHPYEDGMRLPRRFLARFTAELPDVPLLHTATLGYLTDVSNGLADVITPDVGYVSTIDHSAWLHRVPDMNDWHLVELGPRRSGGGRGLFTGSIFDLDGRLVASLYQESLFRFARKK